MNKYLKQLLDALAAKNKELEGHMTKSLDAFLNGVCRHEPI